MNQKHVMYQMKTCILFGNCHCSGIRKFLEFSNFYEEYEVHQFANWELIKDNEMAIPVHLMKNADLVIYQPLSEVYGCYSTNKKNPESFFNILKSDCQTISFPRIHNNALFPIFRKSKSTIDIYGSFINKVDSVEELVYKYNNNMMNYDFVNRMIKNYIVSKRKEEDCDIQIADFLFSNIHKHKLFLTQDHPTSFVFNELTKRICNVLDLDYNFEKASGADENITQLQDSVYDREDCQYPISNYAIRHFNFEYIQEEHLDSYNFYLQHTLHYYLNHYNKNV